MGFDTVKIKNGKGGQAVRIPARMKIDDDKVYLKKIGNTIFIIPYHDPWKSLIEGTEAFTADFMEEREQPNNQNRDIFD